MAVPAKIVLVCWLEPEIAVDFSPVCMPKAMAVHCLIGAMLTSPNQAQQRPGHVNNIASYHCRYNTRLQPFYRVSTPLHAKRCCKSTPCAYTHRRITRTRASRGGAHATGTSRLLRQRLPLRAVRVEQVVVARAVEQEDCWLLLPVRLLRAVSAAGVERPDRVDEVHLHNGLLRQHSAKHLAAPTNDMLAIMTPCMHS